MPRVSEQYHCSVTPTDTLVAYVTDIEHPQRDQFTMIMTDAREQKISVILSTEDALRLHAQLSSFIKEFNHAKEHSRLR
jgi:hypothetical protein